MCTNSGFNLKPDAKHHLTKYDLYLFCVQGRLLCDTLFHVLFFLCPLHLSRGKANTSSFTMTCLLYIVVLFLLYLSSSDHNVVK